MNPASRGWARRVFAPNCLGYGPQLARWSQISLDGFYSGLAALIGDPDLIRRCRDGDQDWLFAFDLSPAEFERLVIMSRRDGMEIMCSLYRANRLSALVNSVPTVVRALGDRLGTTLSEFWISAPGPDMQFRTEGADFCEFVRARYPDDKILNGIITNAENSLTTHYGSGNAPPTPCRKTDPNRS